MDFGCYVDVVTDLLQISPYALERVKPAVKKKVKSALQVNVHADL